MKTKHLRLLFTYSESEKVDLSKFKLEFDIEVIPDGIFKKIRSVCKIPKFRNTQYRLLHCDIYTKNKLFNFKLVDNPLCDRCLRDGVEVIETLNHLYWECPYSKTIWTYVEANCKKILKNNKNFDKNDVLFGPKIENKILKCSHEAIFKKKTSLTKQK